jgi:hypothetical protein
LKAIGKIFLVTFMIVLCLAVVSKYSTNIENKSNNQVNQLENRDWMINVP